LLLVFHGARPGHDDGFRPADDYAVHDDPGVVRMELSAGQLIGFRNRNYLNHSWQKLNLVF